MSKGIVEKYISNRGFGFIQDTDTFNKLFFHISDVEGEDIDVGNVVEYRSVNTSKGLSAKDVVVIKSGISQD